MTDLFNSICIPTTITDDHPLRQAVDLIKSYAPKELSLASLLVLHGLFECWYSECPEVTGIEGILLLLKERIFAIVKDDKNEIYTLSLKHLVYVKRLFLFDWIASFQSKIDKWNSKQNKIIKHLSDLFFSISTSCFDHDLFLKELAFTVDELKQTLLCPSATCELPSEWSRKIRLEIRTIQKFLDWDSLSLLKQIDILIRQIYDYNELVTCVSKQPSSKE